MITHRLIWAAFSDVGLCIRCSPTLFPRFLTTDAAQLVLAPVVTRHWVCIWVGNTLYLAAISVNNALPFLIGSEVLLLPVALLFAFYIVSLPGNASFVVLEGLFGR
ncbi:hypothetical protein JCM5353_008224 [Sporobolomyces roseus]